MDEFNALDVFVVHWSTTKQLSLQDVSLLRVVCKTYNDLLQKQDEQLLLKNSLDILQFAVNKLTKLNCLKVIELFKEIFHIDYLIQNNKRDRLSEYYKKAVNDNIENILVFSDREIVPLYKQTNTIAVLLEFANRIDWQAQIYIVYVIYSFLQKLMIMITPSLITNKKYSLFADRKFYNVLLDKTYYYIDTIEYYRYCMLWNEEFQNDFKTLLCAVKTQLEGLLD